jgi:hypothetical protein
MNIYIFIKIFLILDNIWKIYIEKKWEFMYNFKCWKKKINKWKINILRIYISIFPYLFYFNIILGLWSLAYWCTLLNELRFWIKRRKIFSWQGPLKLNNWWRSYFAYFLNLTCFFINDYYQWVLDHIFLRLFIYIFVKLNF